MKEEFVPFAVPTGGAPFLITLAGTSFCDGSYRISRPHSECLCVEYIISGRGTVFCGEEEYHPSAGDIYILPPGADHLYFSDAEAPWQKLWFNAEGSLINGMLMAYNPTGRVLFSGCGGREYFEQLHNVGRNTALSPEKKHAEAALKVHALLQYLYSGTQKRTVPKEAELLKHYIDSRISENISLKSLSEKFFLSESQLIRIFRRYFGKTPYDYIIEQKIEHAKNLLRNTVVPIKEIAFGLSFCDEHYFSYLFKKKTGKTPSEFRRGADLF